MTVSQSKSSLTSLLPRQSGPTVHLTSLRSSQDCFLARVMDNRLRPRRRNGHTHSLSTRLPSVVEILGNSCPRLRRHLLSLFRTKFCVSRACHALSSPQPIS